jgi:hypothetical protein
VPLNNRKPWPRTLPLLGPERTLVKARAGESSYESWAAGVRAGQVVVSNGPLLELTVNGAAPGATLDGDVAEGEARALFHRPISNLEIVANGQVVAAHAGDGKATEVALPFRIPVRESLWVAARAQSSQREGEPEIRAHTNPVYVLRGGRPVRVETARRAVIERWNREAEYYRAGGLTFTDERQRHDLLEKVERTIEALSK